MPRLFALHDREPGPPVELVGGTPGHGPHDANDRGFGIFHVVNDFEGARRVENLRRINYWYADLDTGTKDEQLERIAKHLPPTRVVETAKGFHVYWKAIDATLGNWRRIVRKGIVPALEADPKASDPLRLLRAPGFYHCKGEPFLVRTVAQKDVAYHERQMLEAFPEEVAEALPSPRPQPVGASFWWKVADLGAREFIQKISGHPAVEREEYRLQPTHGGKANILVKARGRWKSTPCWITREDTLAGVEGGSSPAAWMRWYGRDWKEIAETLKELFPEELG